MKVALRILLLAALPLSACGGGSGRDPRDQPAWYGYATVSLSAPGTPARWAVGRYSVNGLNGEVRVFEQRVGERFELVSVRHGQRDGGRLGWSLAAAGDVDDDGFCDLLVGAPGDGSMGGEVTLLSARSGEVLSTWSAGRQGDSFGYSLAANGFDGEFFVGAPGSKQQHPVVGQVFHVELGKPEPKPFLDGDRIFGSRLAFVAGAAPRLAVGSKSPGRVSLFDTDSSRRLDEIRGPGFDGIGRDLCKIQDRDGVDDFLALARSDYAWILSGKDGSLLGQVELEPGGWRSPQACCEVGDLDGDAVPEVAISLVAPEVEVSLLGVGMGVNYDHVEEDLESRVILLSGADHRVLVELELGALRRTLTCSSLAAVPDPRDTSRHALLVGGGPGGKSWALYSADTGRRIPRSTSD